MQQYASGQHTVAAKGSWVTHPAAGVVRVMVLETGDFWPLGRVPTTLTSYCRQLAGADL